MSASEQRPAAGRPPTHRLSVKSKDGKHGQVGAAWQQEDGTIRVYLTPGVVLDWHDDLMISLFPIDQVGREHRGERRPRSMQQKRVEEGADDHLPDGKGGGDGPDF